MFRSVSVAWSSDWNRLAFGVGKGRVPEDYRVKRSSLNVDFHETYSFWRDDRLAFALQNYLM